MSGLPTYSIRCKNDDGAIKHTIHWKGKFDEIAMCDDERDARNICDLLNAHAAETPEPTAVWNWIPVSERIPDDDIEVLVCTKSEKIYRAVHNDGKWYVADQAIGQRLSAAAITHWIDPIYPNN